MGHHVAGHVVDVEQVYLQERACARRAATLGNVSMASIAAEGNVLQQAISIANGRVGVCGQRKAVNLSVKFNKEKLVGGLLVSASYNAVHARQNSCWCNHDVLFLLYFGFRF